MKIKRLGNNLITILPQLSSTYTKAIMGEETVTFVWEQNNITHFQIGDYIYYGAKFTLNQLPTIKKVSTTLWQYNAVFQSPLYDLLKANYMLFDNTAMPPQGEFTLTGTALTFVTLLVANLNRVSGSVAWFVGEVVDTAVTTLTFSNDSCYAILSRLADEFKTEYDVSGNTIHLSEQTRSTDLVLEYGSMLYDIERTSLNSSDVVTRLYVYGGERNIAASYRSGSKRLLLPSPALYIESNVANYGVIERAQTFDDIYPRFGATAAGTVTGIGASIYDFTDAHLDFNVNSCLVSGTPAKVRFITGQCAGYDLQISSYNNSTKLFKLIANTDDKNYSIPNAVLFPAIGDKYVLIDVIMPDSYRIAAEAELLAKATEYIGKNSKPKVSYRCNFSALYAKENMPDIRCGDTLVIQDIDFGITLETRVVKLTRGITDAYNIQIELSDTVSKSTLTRITEDVATANHGVISTNKDMKQKFNAAYRNLDELRTLVFDTDGYFDPQNIKPLSIETSMLSVGAKSQQLQTNIVFKPNDGLASTFSWSVGSLVHFGISDTEVKTWNIPASSITNIEGSQYIYAKCSRTASAGEIILSSTANKFDFEAGYWSFLLGVLHAPIDGVRGISLTYGQTVINGQYIRTGKISSVTGGTYFDLNTGEIGGNLKFVAADGVYTKVGDGINTAVGNIKQSSRNYLRLSRLDSINGWASVGGTVSLVSDPIYGNVVEYSRPQGGGDFMKVFGIDVSTLKNTDIVYYCIAKNMSTDNGGSWNFGGWVETYYSLNHTSVFKDLGNGWKMYYVAFKAENTISSSSYAFGLNSVGGTWRFHSFGVCKGNTPPSDWTAAPEDIDTAIATAQSKADATDYLTQALSKDTYKPQGLDVGLLWSKVLLMRDTNGDVQGGMSGLTNDNVGNWTGGTYQNAIDSTLTPSNVSCIDRKDGSGHRAKGKLLWDINGNVFIHGNLEQESKLFKVSENSAIKFDKYNIRIVRAIGTHAANLSITFGLNTEIKSGQELTIVINNYRTVNYPVVSITGTFTLFSEQVQFLYPSSIGGVIGNITIPARSFAIIKGTFNKDVYEDSSYVGCFLISSFVITKPDEPTHAQNYMGNIPRTITDANPWYLTIDATTGEICKK